MKAAGHGVWSSLHVTEFSLQAFCWGFSYVCSSGQLVSNFVRLWSYFGAQIILASGSESGSVETIREGLVWELESLVELQSGP